MQHCSIKQPLAIENNWNWFNCGFYLLLKLVGFSWWHRWSMAGRLRKSSTAGSSSSSSSSSIKENGGGFRFFEASIKGEETIVAGDSWLIAAINKHWVINFTFREVIDNLATWRRRHRRRLRPSTIHWTFQIIRSNSILQLMINHQHHFSIGIFTLWVVLPLVPLVAGQLAPICYIYNSWVISSLGYCHK